MIDKQGVTFITVGLYATSLIASFFVLTIFHKEFERSPWLINKKWKRALWIASCFMFVPLLVIVFRLPRFIFSEIRDFLMGNDDNTNGKRRNINDR